MREIKFRAWDKKNRCWFKTDIPFYGFHVFGECTLVSPPLLDRLRDIEITQFTGLKDNQRTKEFPKGKEIYEGDVVKVKLLFEDKWYDEPAEVKYSNQYCAYLINGENLGDWEGDELEVIGNIYENPELVDNDKQLER